MKFLLSTVMLFCCFFLKAQVYETDALKLKAEESISKKDALKPSHQYIEGIVVEQKLKPLDQSLLINTFQLIKIEAKNYASKHSESEMQAFNEEVSQDIFKLDIRVSSELDKMFYISKLKENQYAIKDFLIKENIIEFINCEKCNNDPYTLVENSDEYFILETPSQDEGTYYTNRLIFKK